MNDPTPTTTDEQRGPRLALNREEAADALGISPRLLWDMTKRGEVPHTRIGRRVLYPVAALDQWLVERTQAGGGR